MTVDLVLRDAKVYSPSGIVEAGLAVQDGRIAKIAKDANLPRASEEICLEGRLILPGVIDVHVHLRDQELSYKEDFFTGTAAAANGGVTLVIDMPNNKPVTMSQESLEERMRIAQEKSVVNVAFYSAFPDKAEKMGGIVREGGALAFKFFMSQQVGGINPEDEEKLTEAFIEAAKIGVPVAVHAEDSKLIRERMKRRGMGEGLDDYMRVHSPEVETRAAKQAIRMSQETGSRVHFCHVSSAECVCTLNNAKRRGVRATYEVTPYHLLISAQSLKRLAAIALSNPPPRPQQDIDQLWSSLRDGVVDVLASDHAPHTIEEKSEESIWRVKTGVSGLETMLPLMLTAVNEGRLDISTLVKVMSTNPSRIFGIEDRGELREGSAADLVVVDLEREYKIDSSRFYSKAKYSPFDGWRVKGKPVKTFVSGRLVMDDGEIVAKPGSGEIVRWSG
ncbi:MAG: dihydroorotase family protein [Candidatus Bathyarchaeota archaeon]|nr:dihydroorotase family protein [Candidatus Bathyarchaeota archaeon]